MPEHSEAEERVALVYAPKALRPAYRALFQLDGQLRRIVLSAREPALAQLKLAWWRDACAALSEGQGHPVLQQLARAWPTERSPLGDLVDGWEELAAGTRGMVTGAEAVATARAAALAALTGLGNASACQAAARRWTFVALADHAHTQEDRDGLIAMAASQPCVRLPRALRPLAVLDGLARRALVQGTPMFGDRLSPIAAIRLGIFGR